MVEEEYRCELCSVCFGGDADVERHKRIWHSSREVWLCPTMSDIKSGPLAGYFFPTDEPAEAPDEAICPYCSVLFVDLAQLYPDLEDRDARAKHLETDHDVDVCQPACKFSRSGILLHLANIHSVSLNEYTERIIDLCKREEGPLAEIAGCPPSGVVVEQEESGGTATSEEDRADNT